MMDTVEKIREALDDLDQKIGTLGREAKDEWQGKVHDLKEKEGDLKRRFQVAADDGAEAWEDIKDDFKRAVAELRAAYQDLRDRM